MIFQDRRDAGSWLAVELHQYARYPDVLVLGVVPGGVPVAFEVARMLHAPLEVLVAHRMRVPGEQELSLGTMTRSGMCQLNEELVQTLGVPELVIERFKVQAQQELDRCERLYRGDCSAPDVHDRALILVDEGMTTGATMQVAVTQLRQKHPARIIVGVPVASVAACKKLSTLADAVVCLQVPERFYGVGCWYRHFPPVSDEEICALLKQSRPYLPTVSR